MARDPGEEGEPGELVGEEEGDAGERGDMLGEGMKETERERAMCPARVGTMVAEERVEFKLPLKLPRPKLPGEPLAEVETIDDKLEHELLARLRSEGGVGVGNMGIWKCSAYDATRVGRGARGTSMVVGVGV
jgi:hypothetical protein